MSQQRRSLVSLFIITLVVKTEAKLLHQARWFALKKGRIRGGNEELGTKEEGSFAFQLVIAFRSRPPCIGGRNNDQKMVKEKKKSLICLTAFHRNNAAPPQLLMLSQGRGFANG